MHTGVRSTYVNVGLADLICVNLFVDWPWREKQVMTASQLRLATFVFSFYLIIPFPLNKTALTF